MSRLDIALVDRGLATSRTRARRMIEAGQVLVDGTVATRPAQPVQVASTLTLTEVDPYVARSAHKLLGAIDDLGLADRISGSRCLDAGASTGGFTQVLLEHGAERVEAVDVGHGQLAEPIASDPRVVDRPGLSVRGLGPEDIDGAVDVTVSDLSFISLTLVVDDLVACTREGGLIVLMVKPQFELQRSDLDARGVVGDPRRRAHAVERVAAAARSAGAAVIGAAPSRLAGPSGNQEHFLACVRVGCEPDIVPGFTEHLALIARGETPEAIRSTPTGRDR